jgi:hypothetical protein
MVGLAASAHGAVRFDVVGAPTEVINTGRSEVTGSINLIARGTGNVTGTSTGGAAQMGMIYTNPALQIDDTTASGIQLFFSSGFAAASPSIVTVENRDVNGRCSGFLAINLLPGAAPVEGDFIRIEGIRGRIDAGAAITPGTDLFVDLQSINDPAAASFAPDRVRVAKSLDGMNATAVSDARACIIRITEGFSRAFVDSDSNNDGVNVNDRTSSSGAALGLPTNSTQFVVRLDGIPDSVSGIVWAPSSSASSAGAVLRLLSSSFSASSATATYSYESINQAGSSDLVVESFELVAQIVINPGGTSTGTITASVTLGPAVSGSTGCAGPSDLARPRFLEAFELSITSLEPSSAVAGGSGFTLTVKGAGFLPTSIVRWNGGNRPTTFVNSSRLAAQISAQDIVQAGSASVTVINPALGSAASNSLTFTINLPALTLYYPRLTGAGDGEFTGIALANLSGRTAELKLTGFGTSGSMISGPNITNPAAVTLNAGRQVALIDSQVLGDIRQMGWLKVEGNVSEVVGFFLAFNAGLSVLDGASVSADTATSFVFPEIEDVGFTRIHLVNPNPDSAAVTLELLTSDGTPRVASVMRSVNANGVVAESFTTLFPGVSPNASDYIRVSSNRSVVPFEYLGREMRYAEGLNGQDAAAGATTVYSVQYVVGGPDWQSILSVINLDSTPGSVSLRFISNEGTQIGTVQVLPIAARGKIRITDQRFFIDPGDTPRQGYVEITSSGVRLAGSVVFGDPGRNIFSSALPLASSFQNRMALSQIASNNIYFTGISILNPNDAAARAVIEVYDSDGNPVIAKIEDIPARGRRSQLLTEYFPSLAGVNLGSGYIKITVNRNVAGFALFGTNDLSVLSAVEPQPVP